MTIDDVAHYTEEEKATIIASYPPHELEARTKGIPVLGSGRIFPVPEHAIAIEYRDFPAHWPRIGGMDFGWDHPFAAVELVWDRDSDVVYVAKTHRLKEATPVIHAAALRSWGKELPWAWPRDGPTRDIGGGRHCACAAIQGRGPQHAARARPIRGRQRLSGGRSNGDVDADANGQTKGL